MTTTFKTQVVGAADVFYREAGPADAPVLLVLPGYPTSSHMFRFLIPQLATAYRDRRARSPRHRFDQSAATRRIRLNIRELGNGARRLHPSSGASGLRRYALYIFDYGAPTGMRLAAAHPERVTAIISQNGNAMKRAQRRVEALPHYWTSGSQEARDAGRTALTTESVKTQYLSGADALQVSPDGYMLDLANLSRRGADEIQLDLIYDYRHNVDLYPEWQAYLPASKPPLLAVWGKRWFLAACRRESLSTRRSGCRNLPLRHGALCA